MQAGASGYVTDYFQGTGRKGIVLRIAGRNLW
jgi:hypothetical protein